MAAFVVVVSPIFASTAHAWSFSSFLESLSAKAATVTNAQGASSNSQNTPILVAARNLDPNPAVGGGNIDMTDDGTALEAQTGPSGTAADITNAPATSQISVYTVRAGDSIASIAKMFGVTSNTILWANDIKGGVIHQGDMLIILPVTGIQHKVASGETIDSLAKTYKSTVEDITSYNDLAAKSLKVGDTIIIPNGVVPPTAAQLASAANNKKITKIKNGGDEPFLGGSGPALSGYFGWPVAGGVITQGLHGWNGVDIGAPKGTSIYAAAEGTVIVSKGGGGWNGGYGNYIVIQHPNGTQTLYAHASALLVSVGDSVGKGQTIAKVGKTGLATGYHLHFEVRGAANPFAN